MKKIIDNYIEKIKIYPDNILIENVEIVSNERIKQITKEINNTYKTIREKQERLKLILDKYIKEHKQTLIDKLIKSNINNKIIQD